MVHVLTTTRNRGPTPRTLVLLVLVGSIASVSCYTLVEHPRVASLEFRRPSTRGDCTSCHTRDEVWSYVYPRHMVLDSAPWSSLQYPRWFDSRVRADSTKGAE